METQELLEKKVGTIEKQKLEPKEVKIASVQFMTKNSKGDEMKTPLVQLHCKHPDNEELIKISKIKFLRGEAVLTVGLWAELDKDGNIQKSSAISELLRALKCETLAQVEGKDVETIKESENSPYLCLKVY